jgi:hypothetical protein
MILMAKKIVFQNFINRLVGGRNAVTPHLPVPTAPAVNQHCQRCHSAVSSSKQFSYVRFINRRQNVCNFIIN